ncbi:MAG: hypothetical protein AB1393_06715 [Candidatus Edwardsbacteria bacterium]
MTWWQIVAQAAIIASILIVGVAVGSYFNGKHIKAGIKEVKALIGEVKDLIGEVKELIASEAKATKEILDRMDQRHDERHREVVELISKISTHS